MFYVKFADQGTSYSAFDAFLANLRSKPEVLRVLPLYRTGLGSGDAARFPSDSL